MICLYQGFPNSLNKKGQLTVLQALEGADWPVGVENALASVGVNNVLLLVLVRGMVPHCVL